MRPLFAFLTCLIGVSLVGQDCEYNSVYNMTKKATKMSINPNKFSKMLKFGIPTDAYSCSAIYCCIVLLDDVSKNDCCLSHCLNYSDGKMSNSAIFLRL